MTEPAYRSIKNKEIPEIDLVGCKLRLLAGEFNGITGYQSRYLPLNYYDIHLEPNAAVTIPTEADRSVMVFTLIGDTVVGGTVIQEKTAAKLSGGDHVEISAGEHGAQVLLISSAALDEPIAWGGSLVMNTRAELMQAFRDLDNGTFLKTGINY